jgi:hypothetical protein
VPEVGRGNVSFTTNFEAMIADLCFSKPKKTKTEETENKEWTEKFGEKAAKVIRETVNANVKDYEYLKQFAIKLSK